jgi:predicted RNA polymerase sigma factor
VLGVVYLIFNEGYAATSGLDLTRPALCGEALRLGRSIADLSPMVAEVHGMLALMSFQASRLATRTDNTGAPILMLDQDRSKWDQRIIGEGIQALRRTEALGQPRGSYHLQALIAANHATAKADGDTNWQDIAALYDELATINRSQVVELNRAVAHGMAFGPKQGLKLVDSLKSGPTLKNFHLLPSVRGDFLWKLLRIEEAATAFEQALQLVQNDREKTFLDGRLQDCRKRLLNG